MLRIVSQSIDEGTPIAHRSTGRDQRPDIATIILLLLRLLHRYRESGNPCRLCACKARIGTWRRGRARLTHDQIYRLVTKSPPAIYYDYRHVPLKKSARRICQQFLCDSSHRVESLCTRPQFACCGFRQSAVVVWKEPQLNF